MQQGKGKGSLVSIDYAAHPELRVPCKEEMCKRALQAKVKQLEAESEALEGASEQARGAG
jgi:hypothetical protein